MKIMIFYILQIFIILIILRSFNRIKLKLLIIWDVKLAILRMIKHAYHAIINGF